MADLKDKECGCLLFRKPGVQNLESFPSFPIMYGEVVRIGSKDDDDIRVKYGTDRKTCAVLTIAMRTGFVQVSNPEGADTALNDKLLTKNKYLIPGDSLDIKGKVFIYRSEVLTKEDIDMLEARNTATIRHAPKNRHSGLSHTAFTKVEEDKPARQDETPVIVRKGFTFQTGYVTNITPSKTNFHGSSLRPRRMSGEVARTANSALEKRKSNLLRRRSMDVTLKALVSPFASRKSSLANVREVISRPASDLISWVTPPSACTPIQTPTKRRSSFRNSAILRSAMQTHKKRFSHSKQSEAFESPVLSSSRDESEKDNSDKTSALKDISKTISDKGSFSPRTLKMMQISSPNNFEGSPHHQSEERKYSSMRDPKVYVQRGKMVLKRRSLSAPDTVPEPINRRRSIAGFHSRRVLQTEGLRRSFMRTKENLSRKSTRFTGSGGLQVSVETRKLDLENSLDENSREFENENNTVSDKNKSTSKRKSSLRRSTRSSSLQDKTDIAEVNTSEFDNSCEEKNISSNKTASFRKSRKSTSFLKLDSFKDHSYLSSNLDVEDDMKYDNSSTKIGDINISASKKSFSYLPKSRKSTQSSRPDNFQHRTYSGEISLEKAIEDNENVETPDQRKSTNKKSSVVNINKETEHDESSNTIEGRNTAENLPKLRKSIRLSTRSVTTEDRSYSSENMADQDQLELSLESGNLNNENSLEGDGEHENEDLIKQSITIETSFDKSTRSSMSQYPVNIDEEETLKSNLLENRDASARKTSLNLPKARKSLRTIRRSDNSQCYTNEVAIDDENQPELDLESFSHNISKDKSASIAHKRNLTSSTRALIRRSVLEDMLNMNDVEREMPKCDNSSGEIKEKNISVNKMSPLNVLALTKSIKPDNLKENAPDENRVESSIEIRKLVFQNSLDESTGQNQNVSVVEGTPNVNQAQKLEIHDRDITSLSEHPSIISIDDSNLTKSSGRKSFKALKSHITIEDSAIDSQTPSEEIRDSKVKMSVSGRSARLQKCAVDNKVDATVFDNDNSSTPNELKRKQTESTELLPKMLTSTAQKGHRKSDMIFRQPMLTLIRGSVKRASESMFDSHNLMATQNFERPIQSNSFCSPIQSKSCSATLGQNESQEITYVEKSLVKASYEEIHGKYSTLSGSPVLNRLPSTSKNDCIELSKQSLTDSFVPLYEDVTVDEEDADDEIQEPLRNDLELSGVEQIQASPKSDLPNVSGLKHFFARRASAITPKVRGVKMLFTQKSPLNDLTNVEGIRDILRVHTPLNDLTEVRGVKQLFDVNSPLNDLRNIEGVKETMRRNSPQNDLSDLVGVKRIFDANTPKNNLSEIEGVRTLFKRHNTPQNDIANIPSIKNLYVTEKVQNTPILSYVQMFKTPKVKQSNLPETSDSIDLFGQSEDEEAVPKGIPSQDAFDSLIGRQSYKTYASKLNMDSPDRKSAMINDNITETFESMKKKRKISRSLRTSLKDATEKSVLESLDLFQVKPSDHDSPVRTPTLKQTSTPLLQSSIRGRKRNLIISTPDLETPVTDKQSRSNRNTKSTDGTSKHFESEHEQILEEPTVKKQPIVTRNRRNLRSKKVVQEIDADEDRPKEFKDNETERTSQSRRGAMKIYKEEGDQIKEQPSLRRTRRNLRSVDVEQENENKGKIKKSEDEQYESKVEDKVQYVTKEDDKLKESKGNETEQKPRSRRGAAKISEEEKDKEQPTPRRTRRNLRSKEAEQEQSKGESKGKQNESEGTQSQGGSSKVDVNQDKLKGKLTLRNKRNPRSKESEHESGTLQEKEEDKIEEQPPPTPRRNRRNLRTEKMQQEPGDVNEPKPNDSEDNQVVEKKARPQRGPLKVVEKEEGAKKTTPRRNRRNIKTDEGENGKDKSEETKDVEKINEGQSTRMRSAKNLKEVSTTTEQGKSEQEEIAEPVIEQKHTRRGKKTLKTDIIEIPIDNKELKEAKENLQELTVEGLESSEDNLVARPKTRSRRIKKSENTEETKQKAPEEDLPVKTRSRHGIKNDKNTEGDNSEVIKETAPQKVVTQRTRSRVGKKTDDKEELKDQDTPEENVQRLSVESQARSHGFRLKKVEKTPQKEMEQVAPKRSRRNLKGGDEHLENTNETSAGKNKEDTKRNPATKRKKIKGEDSDMEEQEGKRPRRNIRPAAEEKSTREMRPRSNIRAK